MDHVLLYTEDDAERVEDLSSLDAAVARLQELHESGNTTGRIYREVPVKVETVVRISVDEGDRTPTTPPPPVAPTANGGADESPRSIPTVDYVANG